MTEARWHRLIQALALGFGIGMALISIHGAVLWTDGHVYWAAGERLATGEPLYPAGVDSDTSYRYSPWFAWAWAPLTYLPEPLVAVAWTVAMLAAWTLPLPGFIREGWRGRAVVFLAAPPLLVAALGGNVQPGLVALLYAGLDRRWGPAAIGLAASLKIFPVLFVVVYAARREWLRAGAGLLLGALLWLPVVAYGIEEFPRDIGGALSLWTISPVLYLLPVALLFKWAWRQPSWSVASLLVLVASVRFIPYHLGYLLCSRPLDKERPG